MSALVLMLAVTAALVSSALLAVFLVAAARRRAGVAARARAVELEEIVLVYVLGGPAAKGPLTEREACSRSLHLVHFAKVLFGSGGFRDALDAEVALEAARLRLEARGAVTRLEPPDGSPPGSLPPAGIVVLTPKGAREALAIWARERARYLKTLDGMEQPTGGAVRGGSSPSPVQPSKEAAHA